MNDPHQVTIRVQTLNGQWEVIGTTRQRGVVPESIQLSANEWGSDQCSFALNGQVGALRSDLAAWTPVEVDVAGQTVWDGRIKETPTHDSANGRTISVQAEGWQYHLDDDVYDATYVRAKLTDWADWRSNVLADLTEYLTTWQIQTGDGAIVFTHSDTPTGTPRGAVYLDMGPFAKASRVVVEWEKNQWAAASSFSWKIVDTATAVNGVGYTTLFQLSTATTSGTSAFTAGTPGRYVALMCDDTVAQASDRFFRIKAIRVFTSTTYESGNASILRADTILKDAVVQATDLLSADTSGVVVGTITIDEFVQGLISAREAWQRANAYENYDTRIEVGRKPVFRPRPASAIYEIGEWAGADFQDASVNSGQDIYNRVLVQGTGPDGAALTVERTTTGTMADRRNFRRTTILPIMSTALNNPVGQRFGDLFLVAHSTTPFRGGLQTVGQGGIRRVLGGGSPHPAWLLRDTTQLVRCPVVDVDTGDWTRDARMVNVTYDHDALASTISLDEDREGFDALMARYALASTHH